MLDIAAVERLRHRARRIARARHVVHLEQQTVCARRAEQTHHVRRRRIERRVIEQRRVGIIRRLRRADERKRAVRFAAIAAASNFRTQFESQRRERGFFERRFARFGKTAGAQSNLVEALIFKSGDAVQIYIARDGRAVLIPTTARKKIHAQFRRAHIVQFLHCARKRRGRVPHPIGDIVLRRVGVRRLLGARQIFAGRNNCDDAANADENAQQREQRTHASFRNVAICFAKKRGKHLTFGALGLRGKAGPRGRGVRARLLRVAREQTGVCNQI
ncbi:MAG: hypothetical protein HDKAJFGB_00843 [Anaerolineae bacterium]|nr:hypothetical protein [Anaerolineae bacterium]